VVTLSTVLLFLHIFSGASWFGGVLLFAVVVGPTIGDFTPATSG
jgi:putative copper export protein